MQLRDIIKEFKELFKENYADLKILISDIKGIPVNKLILSDCELNESEVKKLNQYVEEYRTGKPIDKIINESIFYGYKFFVNEHVLSPRMDTEIIIDAVHDIKKRSDNFKVMDICTGSGVILITILNEFKNASGIGIDISDQALLVSEKNSFINNVNERCRFLKQDILHGIKMEKDEKYDVIVSNPPYIKTKDIKILDESVRKYDPLIALDGGDDGTLYYEKILMNIKPFIDENSIIIFEIGYDIECEVKELIKQYGFYLVKEYKDIQNITRVLTLKCKDI